MAKYKHPIDDASREESVQRNQVGGDGDDYYAADLTRGQNGKDFSPADEELESQLQDGNIVNTENVVDEDTGAVDAGTPGHWGVDDDTG